MKRLLLSVLFLSVVLGLVGCGTLPEFDVEKETQIVIGLEAEYPPFNWATNNKTDFSVKLEGQTNMFVDGYDVVMSKMIAEKLGLELVIKAIDWDGLIPALLTGEIDIIIAGMSPRPDRAKTVNFTDEYYRSEQVMVVNLEGKFSQATSLKDFKGARIVAQLGTLQDELVVQIDGAVHLSPLNDYATLALALKSNAADGFVAEYPVAKGMVQANPEQFKLIQFSSGNGFNASDEQVAVACALRQEDLNLLALINDILKDISLETRADYMKAALERQPQ